MSAGQSASGPINPLVSAMARNNIRKFVVRARHVEDLVVLGTLTRRLHVSQRANAGRRLPDQPRERCPVPHVWYQLPGPNAQRCRS